MIRVRVETADDMERLGHELAAVCHPGLQFFLSGELGAGKTTLVRGLLHGLGHGGKVKSPTYTLVEPYSLDGYEVYHFDLYRINSPDELEAMGYREYPGPDAICLLEWPEKAGDYLGMPDLYLRLSHIDSGREVSLEPCSTAGKVLISKISIAKV